jgi:branched-chain amino acid transport system substrate-binding protein
LTRTFGTISVLKIRGNGVLALERAPESASGTATGRNQVGQARPLARRRARLFAAALALVLIAAACAESDDDDAGSGTESTEGGTDETVDEAALGEPNPAAGEPVKVGFISASEADNALAAQFAPIEDGMNMAVEYANEYRGGLGGRPIELFICQGGETPAGTQDCSNQMVNEGVVVVVSPFTANGASVVPIVTAAAIPYFANSGTSAEELRGAGAFSVTGGFPATLAAYAGHARDNDIAKFTIMATDGPGVIDALSGLGNLVFNAAGVEFEITPVPVGTADMTPQLQAAAAGGAGAIGMVGDVTFCSTFLQGYETLALEQPKYVIGTCIDPTVVDTYGGVLEGATMAGAPPRDPSDPDVELFAAMTQKYNPDIDPDPTESGSEAIGVSTLFALLNVMDGYTGEVTAATVMEQIRTKTDVPIFLGEGATFTCDGTAIPLLPNICSADVTIGTLDAEGVLTDPETVDVGPLFSAGG